MVFALVGLCTSIWDMAGNIVGWIRSSPKDLTHSVGNAPWVAQQGSGVPIDIAEASADESPPPYDQVERQRTVKRLRRRVLDCELVVRDAEMCLQRARGSMLALRTGVEAIGQRFVDETTLEQELTGLVYASTILEEQLEEAERFWEESERVVDRAQALWENAQGLLRAAG
jgi:hypothetical protein